MASLTLPVKLWGLSAARPSRAVPRTKAITVAISLCERDVMQLSPVGSRCRLPQRSRNRGRTLFLDRLSEREEVADSLGQHRGDSDLHFPRTPGANLML